MKEKIIRKTTTHELIERSFTTSPKTWRRKNRVSISGRRAREFMRYLWSQQITECMYRALEIQFVVFFETNEQRVIWKYLGRPNQTVRYPGSSIVRLNRNSGKVAHFQYSNRREKPARKGLMEVLGFISLDKNTAKVRVHHQVMPYYTVQTTIENPRDRIPPITPPSRINEGSIQHLDSGESFIKDLCVYPTGHVDRVPEGSCGEVEKEKEEEVIDYTHKRTLDFLITEGLTEPQNTRREGHLRTLSQREGG